MKRWREAVERALVPGLIAGASTSLVAALRGRHDSGSALASINATSHVLWGEGAARIKKPTLAHTVPGYLTNTAAAIFWTTVFEKLCGDLVDRRGAPAALLGAAMTSSIAYVTDYHVVPKRLTPGYEERISRRSLWMVYGVLAATVATGALLIRRRSR